jgi:lysophospholipase L1-like esterase
MTGEKTDLYCLRDGEAERLLAGHHWRRFVVVGDSVAEGLGEPVDGYPDQPWADRVAAELAATAPGFTYRNLGQRDTPIADVRATQLADAIAFEPDLALLAAGGFDALWSSFDAATVEAHLRAIVVGLRESGADVITVGMFDGAADDPDEAKKPMRQRLRQRLRDLADRTSSLAEEFGALHVNLTNHPAARSRNMYSSDGRHGSRRAHAISAAATVRRLGMHVATLDRS